MRNLLMLSVAIAAQPAFAQSDNAVPGQKRPEFTVGRTGWTGMRPPVGDQPHHDNFQVFALDALLATPAGADRAAVLAGMQGHVLARGEIVDTDAQPQASAKK